MTCPPAWLLAAGVVFMVTSALLFLQAHSLYRRVHEEIHAAVVAGEEESP